MADKFISSICDKIVNLPYWCYFVHIIIINLHPVFKIKTILHSEAKRLILEKMVEIINSVSNESDIPVDNEADRARLPDDIYSESRGGLPSQQALLVDGTDGTKSFAINSEHSMDYTITITRFCYF